MTLVLIAEKVEQKGKTWYNRYQCECGNQFLAIKGNVTAGMTTSCGCFRRRVVAQKNTTHALSKKIPRLYKIWKAMRQRCQNPKTAGFHNYGGRGIEVCGEWENYSTFYEWSISNNYSDELSIDRVNVNGNYCPKNCRWATKVEQARNTRKTVGQDVADQIRAQFPHGNRKKGAGTKTLAQQLGVERSTIKNILSGKTYM